MTSNPLNNDREPRARRLLTVAAAATVVLGIGGFVAHERTEARREANVARAVAAKGWGKAEMDPIRGDNCWRAREGFRWRTATNSGWACAGPGDEVTLHEGPSKGSWP